MYLEEAVSSGPLFFGLVPWIIFFPVIGLLINMFFGGMILERSKAGEKIVGGIASAGFWAGFCGGGAAGDLADGAPGGPDRAAGGLDHHR